MTTAIRFATYQIVQTLDNTVRNLCLEIKQCHIAIYGLI